MTPSLARCAWLLASVATLAGCQTRIQKDLAAIEVFRQAAAGTWTTNQGATLVVVPVRARMVTDEAIYLERRDAKGTLIRLLDLKISDEGQVLQRALAFTQDGQWRDAAQAPELLTSLLPKDVRAAGTCDLKPSADTNFLSFSCGGSAPETFQRQ